jgi:hypothetical protein
VLLVHLCIDGVKESKKDKGRVKYAGKHFIHITFYFVYVCVFVRVHVYIHTNTHKGRVSLFPLSLNGQGYKFANA